MKAYICRSGRIRKYIGIWNRPSEENSNTEIYQSLWPPSTPPQIFENGHFAQAPVLTDIEREKITQLIFDYEATRDVEFGDVKCNGQNFIYERGFKDFLETFDLKDFDSIPIQLHHVRTGELHESPIWLGYLTHKVDCVIEEKSHALRAFTHAALGIELRSISHITKSKPLCIRGSSIEGLHLWRDAKYTKNIFCSEELMLAIKREKFKDISFHEVTVD